MSKQLGRVRAGAAAVTVVLGTDSLVGPDSKDPPGGSGEESRTNDAQATRWHISCTNAIDSNEG